MKQSVLSSAHVRAAIVEIQRDGVPKNRRSTKFCMQVAGRHFPPKYVLALALNKATGKSLLPSEHSGGDETNRRLAALGFQTSECACGGIADAPTSQPDSAIARIILHGRPIGDFLSGEKMEKIAENILLDTFKAWPPDYSARFLITPGGFVKSELPAGLSGRSGWNSFDDDVVLIRKAAEKVVRRVVTPNVLKHARNKVASITIGIDLYNSAEMSAELAAFIRTYDGCILRWTGKSYPTPFQERKLIQVLDLESHFLRFEGERVLILECHDLNMFSPRAWSNQLPGGARRKRCGAMRSNVSKFRPTIVLQHPHSTDSERIWLMPWKSLTKKYWSINDWASGICFYRDDGVRSTLAKVAAATRSAKVGLDFVFRLRRGEPIGPKLLHPSR